MYHTEEVEQQINMSAYLVLILSPPSLSVLLRDAPSLFKLTSI
jgi:hypothetical protein